MYEKESLTVIQYKCPTSYQSSQIESKPPKRKPITKQLPVK